jgi:hypothetical protein
MDALFLFLVLAASLVVVDLLAVTIGADSRDGFADDSVRPGLR